ncbi:MAG: hypothetical protein CMF96_05660 [Candidatus Marinimicrobia bacterium]|nr:hypothetical protein [Candidatus Neomarinimicrobiota bacterium]|tara:strand:- start:2652 stop:3272 length:621 start_codon:yes stop_codon:yes gene_type:complete
MKNTKHKTSKFWNNLYKKNEIFWDLCAPTKPFLDLISYLNLEGKKVFIPGCGNGYDVIEIARLGAQVYAVDFAEIPLNNIRNNSDFKNLNIKLIKSNIFELKQIFSEKFDYVFEYTCFCAIDPSDRKKYRDLIYRILKNSGKFISLFFPILKPENNVGPPFGVNLDKTLKLFKNNNEFKLLSIHKEINSNPERKGNEVLVVLEKNG